MVRTHSNIKQTDNFTQIGGDTNIGQYESTDTVVSQNGLFLFCICLLISDIKLTLCIYLVKYSLKTSNTSLINKDLSEIKVEPYDFYDFIVNISKNDKTISKNSETLQKN